jgi:hypothetical protein
MEKTMTRVLLSAVLGLSVATFTACSHEHANGHGDGGDTGDGGVAGDPDFAGIGGPDTDGDGVPDSVDNCPNAFNPSQSDWNKNGVGDACDPAPPPTTCGNQAPPFSQLAPNILIILDRSLSMGQGTAPTKWTQAKTALDAVSNALATQIRFGLAVFEGAGAGGAMCNAPTLQIAVTNNRAVDIQASYSGLSPGGATPTRLAFHTAYASGWLNDAADPQDSKRSKNILLITDGEPNCAVGHESDYNYSDITAVLGEIDTIHGAGIAVHVVGFGSGVNAANLNDMATHGGTDNPSDPANAYYQANNATDLENALKTIGAQVVSCDFDLTGMPGDPNLIYVTANGVPLTRNDANGFNYDATGNAIHLTGTACANVKSGAVSAANLQIIFGCPADGSPPIL